MPILQCSVGHISFLFIFFAEVLTQVWHHVISLLHTHRASLRSVTFPYTPTMLLLHLSISLPSSFEHTSCSKFPSHLKNNIFLGKECISGWKNIYSILYLPCTPNLGDIDKDTNRNIKGYSESKQIRLWYCVFDSRVINYKQQGHRVQARTQLMPKRLL